MKAYIDSKKAIKLRVSHNITAITLAKEVGISKGTVSLIESGKLDNTSLLTACKYAKFFDVPVTYILNKEWADQIHLSIIKDLQYHGIIDNETLIKLADHYGVRVP